MKILNRILLFVLSMMLFSCEDILEEDITDDIVHLVSPVNQQEITSNVVNFQWQVIKGAEDYRIQIFSSNQAMVLDSLVGSNTAVFPMAPGNYQWRVRGENFAYTSSYSFTSTFTVVETDDLTNQQVILSSPNVNYYNSNSITFTWQAINVAEKYNFELVNVTNGQTLVHQVPDLVANTLTLNNTILADDAEYQWKVKALNSLPSSTPFAIRNFFIDRVNPNQPVNATPTANSTQVAGQPITFTWSIPADNGTIQSTISYVIEFSNNSSFSSIIQTSNSATNSFQQTFQEEGDYFWRIRAKDQAGNISGYSNHFKFTIE